MHFPVLVAVGPLPALEPTPVLDAIHTVVSLWLTRDDETWGWDWYQIGGGWRGLFDARPGAEILEGSAGVPEMMSLRLSGTAPEARGADVVRLRDIDWESTAASFRARIRSLLHAEVFTARELQGSGVLLPVTAGELQDSGVLLPVTAILLQDGALIEFGSPLWDDASPVSKVLWQRTWRWVLAQLPEDTVVALIDCHR